MLVSFILTIVLSGLLLLLGLFLFRLAWLRRNPAVEPATAGDEKRGRAGNAANSWLRGARTAFLLTLVLLSAAWP